MQRIVTTTEDKSGKYSIQFPNLGTSEKLHPLQRDNVIPFPRTDDKIAIIVPKGSDPDFYSTMTVEGDNLEHLGIKDGDSLICSKFVSLREIHAKTICIVEFPDGSRDPCYLHFTKDAVIVKECCTAAEREYHPGELTIRATVIGFQRTF